MSPRSEKVKNAAPDFRAVYALVDARSEGRCEVWLSADGNAGTPRVRCPKPARDHHHCFKPRRAHHTDDAIVHLCRAHHDRCDWPYQRGRLVVTPLGGGRFDFALRVASSKFALRGQGE